jgi:chorismate dehydratase
MTQPMRVGRINFSNVLPVFHFIDSEAEANEIQFVSAVPTELNRMLAAGEIVAGPISAFSYAEYAEQYYCYADLSVSSRGSVGSIFLFSKRPIDDLHGRIVALPTTSASSVNLLKILLQEYFHVQPEYVTRQPHLEQMMQEADAALLIGDDALYWSLQKHPYHVYDLGSEWYGRTGLPMTFAVWAVRRDFIEQRLSDAKRLHQLFLRSKRQGLAKMDLVIDRAVELYGQDRAFWEGYFHKLIYDFTGDLLLGAETYFQAAYRQGLLARPIKVELWGGEQ